MCVCAITWVAYECLLSIRVRHMLVQMYLQMKSTLHDLNQTKHTLSLSLSSPHKTASLICLHAIETIRRLSMADRAASRQQLPLEGAARRMQKAIPTKWKHSVDEFRILWKRKRFSLHRTNKTNLSAHILKLHLEEIRKNFRATWLTRYSTNLVMF